ncbi:hypothetical protein KC349_g2990 [Hortaea werneckii]|nr:hypothetical protein KC349_g2990 [Hortaea werneckii]
MIPRKVSIKPRHSRQIVSEGSDQEDQGQASSTGTHRRTSASSGPSNASRDSPSPEDDTASRSSSVGFRPSPEQLSALEICSEWLQNGIQRQQSIFDVQRDELTVAAAAFLDRLAGHFGTPREPRRVKARGRRGGPRRRAAEAPGEPEQPHDEHAGAGRTRTHQEAFGADGSADEEEDEAAGASTVAPPARNHRWGAIMRLTTFAVPPAIVVALRNNPSEDGYAFLCGKAQGDVLDIPILEAGAEYADITTRYDYTIGLERRMHVLDKARSAAVFLMWREVVRLCKEGSVRRLGPNNEQAVTALAQAVSSTLGTDDGLDAGDTRPSIAATVPPIDNIRKWARYGEKLRHLTDTFGAGALLVLAEKLSASFLETKSPPGEARDEAYAKLEELGLRQLAEPYNQLAVNIQAFLIRPEMGNALVTRNGGTTKDRSTKDRSTKDKITKDKSTKDKSTKDKITKDKSTKGKSTKTDRDTKKDNNQPQAVAFGHMTWREMSQACLPAPLDEFSVQASVLGKLGGLFSRS